MSPKRSVSSPKYCSSSACISLMSKLSLRYIIPFVFTLCQINGRLSISFSMFLRGFISGEMSLLSRDGSFDTSSGDEGSSWKALSFSLLFLRAFISSSLRLSLYLASFFFNSSSILSFLFFSGTRVNISLCSFSRRYFLTSSSK